MLQNLLTKLQRSRLNSRWRSNLMHVGLHTYSSWLPRKRSCRPRGRKNVPIYRGTATSFEDKQFDQVWDRNGEVRFVVWDEEGRLFNEDREALLYLYLGSYISRSSSVILVWRKGARNKSCDICMKKRSEEQKLSQQRTTLWLGQEKGVYYLCLRVPFCLAYLRKVETTLVKNKSGIYSVKEGYSSKEDLGLRHQGYKKVDWE